MLSTVRSLPSQRREAWACRITAPVSPLAAAPVHVIALGMGGSAIAADLLGLFLAPRLSVPRIAVRGARLRASVGRSSVVIATSDAGETQETLEAADTAVRAGARLVAITSGGSLEALAGRHGTVTRAPHRRAASMAMRPPRCWTRWRRKPGSMSRRRVLRRNPSRGLEAIDAVERRLRTES